MFLSLFTVAFSLLELLKVSPMWRTLFFVLLLSPSVSTPTKTRDTNFKNSQSNKNNALACTLSVRVCLFILECWVFSISSETERTIHRQVLLKLTATSLVSCILSLEMCSLRGSILYCNYNLIEEMVKFFLFLYLFYIWTLIIISPFQCSPWNIPILALCFFMVKLRRT